MNYKTLFLISLFIAPISVAAANQATVELTHISPTKEESTWVREKQFTPRYPMELAMKGVIGCGIFKVKVNANGSTDSIELVNSMPKKVIFKPAKKVIKDWDWKLAKGKIEVPEEKLIRLDFCMGGTSQEEAEKRCQLQAKLACE